MSMSKFASKFDYLLNAFEQASQSKEPAIFGYAAKRQALFDYVRDLERRASQYVGDMTAAELAELRKAIGELAHAMGNPAVEATGDQTIESETIREALRRVKLTKDAVMRLRDAGLEVDAPL